jgi:hypothetical protein
VRGASESVTERTAAKFGGGIVGLQANKQKHQIKLKYFSILCLKN